MGMFGKWTGVQRGQQVVVTNGPHQGDSGTVEEGMYSDGAGGTNVPVRRKDGSTFETEMGDLKDIHNG